MLQLFALIFCSTPKIIDGNCFYFPPFINIKQKFNEELLLIGNGLVFFLPHQHLAMFSCTQYTTEQESSTKSQIETLKSANEDLQRQLEELNNNKQKI